MRGRVGGEPVELTLGAGDGPPLVVELVTRGRSGAAALPGSGTDRAPLSPRLKTGV
ncbi:hypothetical protein [Candidatus Solirubrobacter pratensis]|uniref:hypothetical protein n=1 Tax=Candidatus Solirubrobacter pratensis TaxID=1298857 RepID=UPI000410BD13|nr:hypothetical protein [Candidatus Solirubrobacter pratensis]